MGSGRGQTRRAKAQVAQQVRSKADQVTFKQHVWVDFVAESGLTKMKLLQYYGALKSYLELNPNAGKISVEEMNKLHLATTAELFADAVAVGALDLPSPYTTEDFVFEMVPGIQSFDDDGVEASLKGKPELRAGVASAYLLRQDVPLASNGATFFLRQIGAAAQSLILQDLATSAISKSWPLRP